MKRVQTAGYNGARTVVYKLSIFVHSKGVGEGGCQSWVKFGLHSCWMTLQWKLKCAFFFLISVWYSSGSQMVSRGLAKGKLWGWRKWKWWTQLIRPKKTHITKPNYACYNHINLVPHDVRRNQVTFLKTCCPMHVEIHTHWKRYLVVSIYITIAIHTCLQHSILVLLSLKIVWIE